MRAHQLLDSFFLKQYISGVLPQTVPQNLPRVIGFSPLHFGEPKDLRCYPIETILIISIYVFRFLAIIKISAHIVNELKVADQSTNAK